MKGMICSDLNHTHTFHILLFILFLMIGHSGLEIVVDVLDRVPKLISDSSVKLSWIYLILPTSILNYNFVRKQRDRAVSAVITSSPLLIIEIVSENISASSSLWVQIRAIRSFSFSQKYFTKYQNLLREIESKPVVGSSSIKIPKFPINDMQRHSLRCEPELNWRGRRFLNS